MLDQNWVQVNKNENKVFTIYFSTYQQISEIDSKIEWVTYLRAKVYTKLDMGDLLSWGWEGVRDPTPPPTLTFMCLVNNLC